MRVAIAAWGQETSSFGPVVTDLDTFELYDPRDGQEMLQNPIGTVAGLLDAASSGGVDWTPVPLFSAWAGASGIITGPTLRHYEKKLAESLRNAMPVDAFFFALHGAGQADGVPDTEGHLLTVSREIVGDDTPIVITLDHHANVTDQMMRNVDGLVGHRTQPHDPFDTGRVAGKQLFDLMQGLHKPTLAWRKIPLITHQEQYLTSRDPMKSWFALAREMETRPGVVSVSTFPMQPWLDVPQAGWSAVVITDGDHAQAERLADELADAAWQRRSDFMRQESIPVEAAVRRAVSADSGLVILADTGDSVAAGGPGDSTDILAEMFRQSVDQSALVPVVDPEAVKIAIDAGLGARITVMLGGKFDSTYGSPTKVTATVSDIRGGVLDPGNGRMPFDVGKAVLLVAGSINIVVGETRGMGAYEPIVFGQFGLDPAAAKMVVLKTASNWQNFADLISEVVRVDTIGSTMSRMTDFNWTRIPRPIYPLDQLRTRRTR